MLMHLMINMKLRKQNNGAYMNRIVICFLLLLICTRVAAQEYTDTAVVAAPIEDVDDEEQATNETDVVSAAPVMRMVPDSVVHAMKQDKKFEYANDPEYWKEKPVRTGKSLWDYIAEFFSSEAVRSIGYVLLGGLLLFILYRIIIVNNLYMSRASRKLKNADGGDTDDIHEVDLDEALQKAIAAGDHRMAVRYLYLQTLHKLDAKGWIRYHAQATNNDYQLQVTPYGHAREFRFLTRAYDYVWYGGFALTNEQFTMIHDQFLGFFKVLNH